MLDKIKRYKFYKDIPHISGIYFLYDGDELDYIGQSHDVRGRLFRHHRYNPDIHEVGVLVTNCSDEERIAIESKLVEDMDPRLNYIRQTLSEEERDLIDIDTATSGMPEQIDVKGILNQRSDGLYQLNLSVKKENVQEFADAMEWMMRRNILASRSELAVNAIIEYVKQQQT